MFFDFRQRERIWLRANEKKQQQKTALYRKQVLGRL
jgi:hypothetical protein